MTEGFAEEQKKIGIGRGHSIFIETRENCVVNGVEEVVSFDESGVCMQTPCGLLEIFGEGLHISKLNLEDGQVIVRGVVNGVEYSGNTLQHGKGLFSKMFR